MISRGDPSAPPSPLCMKPCIHFSYVSNSTKLLGSVGILRSVHSGHLEMWFGLKKLSMRVMT